MCATHNLHSVCVNDAAADVVTSVNTVTASVGGTSVAADDTVCVTVDNAGDDFTVVFCGGNAVVCGGNAVVCIGNAVVVCSVVVTDVVTSATAVTESVVTAIPLKIPNKYYRWYTNKQIISILILAQIIDKLGTRKDQSYV